MAIQRLKIDVTDQNGADRNQAIVHPSSLGDVARLESQLETTATHSETHGI